MYQRTPKYPYFECIGNEPTVCCIANLKPNIHKTLNIGSTLKQTMGYTIQHTKG